MAPYSDRKFEISARIMMQNMKFLIRDRHFRALRVTWTVPKYFLGIHCATTVLPRTTLLARLQDQNWQSEIPKKSRLPKVFYLDLSEIHVIIRPQNRYSRKTWDAVEYRGFPEKRIGRRSSENDTIKVVWKVFQKVGSKFRQKSSFVNFSCCHERANMSGCVWKNFPG